MDGHMWHHHYHLRIRQNERASNQSLILIVTITNTITQFNRNKVSSSADRVSGQCSIALELKFNPKPAYFIK